MKNLIGFLITLGAILPGLFAAPPIARGDQLLKNRTGDLGQQVACLYCLQGYIDGVLMADTVQKQKTICLPKEFTVGQFRLLIIKELTSHPKELQQDARFRVAIALLDNFPCN